MANLFAQDVLNVTDPIVRAARAALERDSAYRSMKAPPAIEQYDPEVSREPISLPERNIFTDPESKLNRGLANLAGNAASVIFGEESGVPLVDYGAVNVPGVGAGAILAAGGMPGVLDVVGMGELKNLKKIPKYTYEFVQKHFGEKGLKNLDNALSKYPKADKPSVNDAVYIMRSGIGGDVVPIQEPIVTSLDDVISKLMRNADDASDEITIQDLLDIFDDRILRAREQGNPNFSKAIANLKDDVVNLYKDNDPRFLTQTMLWHDIQRYWDEWMDHVGDAEEIMSRKIRDTYNQTPDGRVYSTLYQENKNSPVSGVLRELSEREQSPLQDWERIITAQERREAKQQAKAEKKAAKQAEIKAAPVKERTEQIVKEQPPVPKVEEVVPEAPNVEPSKPIGGPNKWRENGWSSKQYDPNFYEKFGKNLTEESKRDLFVVDSLAKHWAQQLKDEGQKGAVPLSARKIINGLDRASGRHQGSNYDVISKLFEADIDKNLASGNMPGTSVVFDQKFKNNLPVPYRSTPTLKLSLKEKPKVYDNVRIWADMVEGPDLYELLFRPAVDRKLHDINPEY